MIATALFLYSFIRKEAVLSSQIEGTQSSFSDLLMFEIEEAPGAPSRSPQLQERSSLPLVFRSEQREGSPHCGRDR